MIGARPRWMIASAGLLAAALSAGASGAVAAETVLVYSAHHQVADRDRFAAFTQETGIAVTIVEIEADDLAARLAQPGAEGPADLVLTPGAAVASALARAHRLVPITDRALLDAVPKGLADPGGLWLPLAYWARVVVYRQDRFQPADITGFADLTDPKFVGSILIRSASSPYNQAMVASLIADDGIEATENWARGLVANLARPPQGGDTDQLQALANGDGGVAIVNTRYWARYAASSKVTEREVLDGLAVVFPDQTAPSPSDATEAPGANGAAITPAPPSLPGRGTPVDVVAAGLAAGAPHPAAALALIGFLLRADTQAQFAAADFDYPIRVGVPPVPELAALGAFRIDLAGFAKIGAFTAEAQRVMARAGWE